MPSLFLFGEAMSAAGLTDPVEDAKKNGLQCILPQSHEIQIDLDSNDDRGHMYAMIELLRQNGIELIIRRETRSRGGNAHIYIDAPRELSDIERIAFQACLGSDRKRELLSILRAWDGRFSPTAFFEVPVETGMLLTRPGGMVIG